MKLQHYLGGLEGLGPVSFEKRVFVEPWEKRIFGIHVAMMALSSQLPLPAVPSGFKTVWTWADLRKGAESLNPFDYFKYRYYEKWLGGISGYFVSQGYSRVTSSLSFFEVLALLEMVGHPPLGEPIKLASCVWE